MRNCSMASVVRVLEPVRPATPPNPKHDRDHRQNTNRQAQKHACGVQLLTTGWPQGMGPKDREYMIGWMIMQVPKIVEFLKEHGHVTDHNAREVKLYLNIFSTDPVTVPAGGGFFSTMTLLTFKAFDLRTAFLERLGGGTGSPLYKDDNTPIHGHHIKVAPASPQWQRKLEAPLRVLLSCINSHSDHNSQSKLTILWKTLTLLEPKQGDDFKEDIQAWARLFFTMKRMVSLWVGWRLSKN